MRTKRDLPIEYVTGGLRETERQIQAQKERKLELIARCTHRDREGRPVLRLQAAGERYDHDYWSCDACGGGQRELPVELRVKKILSEEMSFYQYADAITRLMTRDNVNYLMGSLPEPFAGKYLQHALECFLPKGGKRIVIGRSLPDEALEAFREWNERQQ